MIDSIKQLKTLRSVSPDPDYSAHSRNLILSERPTLARKQKEHSSMFMIAKRQTTAIILSSALVVLTGFFGISYLKEIFTESSSVAKANEINSSIQIKLDEIKYFIETSAPMGKHAADRTNTMLSEAKKELEAATDSLKKDDVKDFMVKIRASQEIIAKMKEGLNDK